MLNGLGRVLFAGSWNAIKEGALLAFPKTNASAAFIRKQTEYPAALECSRDRAKGMDLEWAKGLESAMGAQG
jgi:hypothetical protein